ncbi:SGNH/GDSL hydrolase family protein [Actinomycetospora sp. TBRC 11914]|uniref:SGNH/GDSL hydrolase family protein n=1 Tax=Actinomycetospora sp. TBRC 11914 TaxID=2729387 RepID=UPI00145D55D9|nr:SGNH/GDSL hydrolase family protein [Actinomycetospora sp. TBRC 11914]NMO88300.1 SGNH/GDSL hydrolase family protein [Actinomycetospora sp. TBRC 11914]
MNGATRYVALGSSFGAGPGLRPRAPGSPWRAGRSAINYAHLAAGHLALDLHDATYSGARVADILAGARQGRGQLAALDASTALVTVTAGGNDIGYLPALTLASLPGAVRERGRVRRRLAGLTDDGRLGDRLQQLERDLERLAIRIRAAAPSARLVLVDYLTILPSRPDPAPPLPTDVADWGRRAASGLSRTLRSVAARTDDGFVAAADASRAHHAWSAAPWTRRFHYSLRGGAAYHPNATGMANVARLLVEHLEDAAR